MPTRGWVYWREQREEGRLGRPLKLLKDVKSNCDLLTGPMLVMHNLVGFFFGGGRLKYALLISKALKLLNIQKIRMHSQLRKW